jgi:hypothetical protein
MSGDVCLQIADMAEYPFCRKKRKEKKRAFSPGLMESVAGARNIPGRYF